MSIEISKDVVREAIVKRAEKGKLLTPAQVTTWLKVDQMAAWSHVRPEDASKVKFHMERIALFEPTFLVKVNQSFRFLGGKVNGAAEPVVVPTVAPTPTWERVGELMGQGTRKSDNVEHMHRRRALNLRNGSADRASADWPSRVLHDIGPRMEFGLDRRRLMALADYIEGLERIAPWRPNGKDWTDGPVAVAKFVHGATPVKGFALRGGEEGYGVVEFSGGNASAYWLTGYGLVCWGWGAGNGLSHVADMQRIGEVQAVLDARPVTMSKVQGLGITQVRPHHVAMAIREFLDCGNALTAWKRVAAKHNGQPVGRVAPKTLGEVSEQVRQPVAAPPPVPPMPRTEPVAPKLTDGEGWKALVMADDWAGMAEMAEKKMALYRERIDAIKAEVEERCAKYEAEVKKWHRRHVMAVSAMEVE